MADAAAAVRPAVRGGDSPRSASPSGGKWPLPDTIEAEGFVGLNDTMARLAGAGFAVTGLVAASEDDWDRYESLHWRAIEESLAENPDHAGAEDVRVQHERVRSEHFALKRALLGWAIFVGRKI
jgi:hypothetical protein